MTKKQRNKLYKEALLKIENQSNLPRGLCYLLDNTRKQMFPYSGCVDYYTNRPKEFELFFESKTDAYFKSRRINGFKTVRRVIVELMIAMTE